MGTRDVDTVKRHHKRFLVRDAREGRPTGPRESDLALAKSISLWNWNVEHSVKVGPADSDCFPASQSAAASSAAAAAAATAVAAAAAAAAAPPPLGGGGGGRNKRRSSVRVSTRREAAGVEAEM